MTGAGKYCRGCGQTLAPDAFGRDRHQSDGLTTRCRPCRKSATASYRAKDPERARRIAQEHYQRNRLQRLAQIERWRAANDEKARSYARSWQRRNPDAVRASVSTQRAERMQRCPAWADQLAIAAVYRSCREVSEQTGVVHHVDHIVPLKGKYVSGLHVAHNLQVMPARDNKSKYNTHDSESFWESMEYAA